MLNDTYSLDLFEKAFWSHGIHIPLIYNRYAIAGNNILHRQILYSKVDTLQFNTMSNEGNPSLERMLRKYYIYIHVNMGVCHLVI